MVKNKQTTIGCGSFEKLKPPLKKFLGAPLHQDVPGVRIPGMSCLTSGYPAW